MSEIPQRKLKRTKSVFSHNAVRQRRVKIEKAPSMPKYSKEKLAKMRRPVVRFKHPETKELSEVAVFGTDVFISAGVLPSGENAAVTLEQDENTDVIVELGGEHPVPAGSYTIENGFTGMFSRVILANVIPAMLSPNLENTVRVASVVLPIIKFASGHEYLLLTQRTHMKKGTYNDFWVFPGGHVEHGESLKEGGIREVKEETGLMIDEDDLTPLCAWQEFMATSKKQLQFIISNFFCEVEVDEDLDEELFLLTLGLQLKEVKRAALIPRSNWRILAHTENFTGRYSKKAYDDINWPEEDDSITHYTGILNSKNHAEITKIAVGDILKHSSENPGIGMPHSFAVHHLLGKLTENR